MRCSVSGRKQRLQRHQPAHGANQRRLHPLDTGQGLTLIAGGDGTLPSCSPLTLRVHPAASLMSQMRSARGSPPSRGRCDAPPNSTSNALLVDTNRVVRVAAL